MTPILYCIYRKEESQESRLPRQAKERITGSGSSPAPETVRFVTGQRGQRQGTAFDYVVLALRHMQGLTFHEAYTMSSTLKYSRQDLSAGTAP